MLFNDGAEGILSLDRVEWLFSTQRVGLNAFFSPVVRGSPLVCLFGACARPGEPWI